ncbi:ComEC/Rec2 family competence protein [Aliiroseovarius sp. KMU-50]|uniref:ComEC/Rec2 family competence protein n=1 Tax=Aliiroseovarius salicola TaxID=3009082 RepID=A0ABT4W2E2_9RHOB|nr:ComEC/Rec2 family competence protein [Aliiroseovarius sp. KMU-50]MDA5093962.1 ComEC/Rec2 family competence protein [Aliiroseovarius sp. KMU-50]
MLARICPLSVVQGCLTRIERERGRFLHWVPVFLAIGIGVYFQLPVELGRYAYAGLGLLVALLGLVSVRWPWGVGPLVWGVVLVAAGLLLAAARAHYVAAPVLDFRYYGPVEGRIIAVDRSQKDAMRLTLDQVRLTDTALDRVPKKVRISLYGKEPYAPAIGQRVAITAHLSGPNGPVEPGGFDFQRMAWFRGIGAVGYSRNPVVLMARPDGHGVGVQITRLRMALSAWVREILPGETGAFAAAITTGDRSSMSRATLDALRGSNLAHLLAISGLHMGLLTGFVYQAARYLMALSPSVALHRPTKKIAAVLAMLAGAFYLLLSGGNVATERAYIMVATMLIGVLFDRRALSLRAVAMAAVIVLVLHPEALTEPGFQMSFAATTALVSVFGWIGQFRGRFGPRWVQPIMAVVLSSAVAAAATAPVAAAHFNQVSHFGLIANLLSVPLMGMLIMPAAVLAALLGPFGLGWLAIKLMALPIDWIIGVAYHVSSMEGAIGYVAQPPPTALPAVAVGGALIVLLSGREKIVGAALVVIGGVLWTNVDRPPVLISQTGGLVGVLKENGRALSKLKGDGFAASVWLENDGAPLPQSEAYALGAFRGDNGVSRSQIGAASLVHLSGKLGSTQLNEVCGMASLVVMNRYADQSTGECWVIDAEYLRHTGAIALWPELNGWRIETARARQGDRLWTRWQKDQQPWR